MQDHLDAGRLRLVFVADELPDTLVRLIEFLNEQMATCEVLGVEVPQYLSDGQQWGSGKSPGVSAWYRIDGVDCPVWYLQASTYGGDSKPYVMLWLPKMIERLATTTLDQFEQALADLPDLQQSVAAGRADPGSGSQPSVSLHAGTSDQVATLLASVDAIR